MSQYGAYGRAKDGQSWAQILGHYFTDTTIGAQDANTVVRVLLASSYSPTSDSPALIRAQKADSSAAGTWFSETFPTSLNNPFPADSYADMRTNKEGSWTVSVRNADGVLLAAAETEDFLMQPSDGGTLFYMKFRDSLRKYDLYRGQMRMRATSSTTMQAVNIVQMDDYLKGVVPSEVPALWPKAAVRAQAVAARSYVSFKLRTTNTWDVKPDSSHQVYGGVNNEHSASTDAVLVTSGKIVVTSSGNVAETLFHAIAGGHTEHNEYAFLSGGKPGTPVSYLRGKPDVDSNGVPFEIKHSNPSGFAWVSGEFTWQQLSDILAKDSRTDVGLLSDIQFERGVSGRAWKVTVVGPKGTKSVTGGAFKNIYNKNKLSGGNLRSNMYFLEEVP